MNTLGQQAKPKSNNNKSINDHQNHIEPRVDCVDKTQYLQPNQMDKVARFSVQSESERVTSPYIRLNNNYNYNKITLQTNTTNLHILD